MLMSKKTSVAGAFARKKSYEFEGQSYEADLKDGDIITILDSGSTIEGEFGKQTVFKIKTRNGEKNLALNQTTVNNLIDAFGNDSENYIGQQAKVWVIKALVSGKLQQVAYLSSTSAVMDEDGRFILDNMNQLTAKEDISAEDVGF